MNHKKTITFGILQLFIISLFFIALGVTIGDDTLPLSFLALCILGTIILLKGQPVIIDKTTKVLFIFFIALILSVCYRLFVVSGDTISRTGEIMYIKNLKQLAMFFVMILHFLILRNILKNYDVASIKRIIRFFILISLLVSLYSIYQFFALLYDWPFTDMLRISKSYSIIRGRETSSWIGLPRAWAFMPEPSFWGTFLLIPFSLVLPFAIEKGATKMKLYLFIFLIAQFLTFSRSCWFGSFFICTCFMFFEIIFKKRMVREAKISLVIFLIILLLVIVTVPDKSVFLQRLADFSDSSALKRVYVQKLVFLTFLKHPIIGIGFGSTPFITGYQVTYNWYFQLLLETGIVGFSIFIFFLLQIWNRFIKYENIIKFSHQDNNMKNLLIGLKLAFFSILFTWVNLPAYNFSYIWFILALITILPITYRNTEPTNDRLLKSW